MYAAYFVGKIFYFRIKKVISSWYYKTDFTVPTALIMGSEGSGVSEEYLKLADDYVAIPLMGEIQSLNVSNAASILIYEAVRQRLETKD